ncbi:hypothetical protein [Roseomonas populi]|uniref:Type II secretion system protein GspC N-terminal domain-containing protein n=1 Tax=Roseomonas populi TaxID=3121582 RepID=A0ABT1X6B4_9PROT|nr:hypothetical protein [Roseomonas pecuniae]MCR0983645.1 hypothetical protein [Roseomonas pecuniae]
MMLRLPLLAAACLGLGYLSTREQAVTLPSLPAIGQAATTGAVSGIAIVPPPDPPAGPWSEQSERPLFSMGRRPPAKAAPEVAEQPEEAPPPTAASGVIVRAESSLALLRLADGRLMRVAVGDQVDGWQVERISGEGVELMRGTRSLSLGARVPSAVGVVRSN